jgi:hypothetical protein
MNAGLDSVIFFGRTPTAFRKYAVRAARGIRWTIFAGSRLECLWLFPSRAKNRSA